MTHAMVRFLVLLALIWGLMFSARGLCANGDCWSACENVCADYGGLVEACECSWLGNDCGCICADFGGSCADYAGCRMADH